MLMRTTAHANALRHRFAADRYQAPPSPNARQTIYHIQTASGELISRVVFQTHHFSDTAEALYARYAAGHAFDHLYRIIAGAAYTPHWLYQYQHERCETAHFPFPNACVLRFHPPILRTDKRHGPPLTSGLFSPLIGAPARSAKRRACLVLLMGEQAGLHIHCSIEMTICSINRALSQHHANGGNRQTPMEQILFDAAAIGHHR